MYYYMSLAAFNCIMCIYLFRPAWTLRETETLGNLERDQVISKSRYTTSNNFTLGLGTIYPGAYDHAIQA